MDPEKKSRVNQVPAMEFNFNKIKIACIILSSVAVGLC